jgi:hypothetical protein
MTGRVVLVNFPTSVPAYQNKASWVVCVAFCMTWTQHWNCVLFCFVCGSGSWTQDLHLEPLQQPYLCAGIFEMGLHELFALAGSEPWSSWSLHDQPVSFIVSLISQMLCRLSPSCPDSVSSLWPKPGIHGLPAACKAPTDCTWTLDPSESFLISQHLVAGSHTLGLCCPGTMRKQDRCCFWRSCSPSSDETWITGLLYIFVITSHVEEFVHTGIKMFKHPCEGLDCTYLGKSM